MHGTTRGLWALALSATCLAAAAVGQADDLAEPVRLKAGSEYIDTGEHVAHSGPLLCDYDGDGLQDLLVGNFRGHIQVYRNAGTDEQPVLESKGLLEAGGGVLKIHNW